MNMNFRHGFAVLVGLAALAFAHSTAAASDCLQLGLTDTRALCVGQRSPIRIDVENTCLSPTPIAMKFAMDHEPLRGVARDVVPGSSTLSKNVLVRVPATASVGSHRLTVTTIDASGQVSTMDADVTINACTSM